MPAYRVTTYKIIDGVQEPLELDFSSFNDAMAFVKKYGNKNYKIRPIDSEDKNKIAQYSNLLKTEEIKKENLIKQQLLNVQVRKELELENNRIELTRQINSVSTGSFIQAVAKDAFKPFENGVPPPMYATRHNSVFIDTDFYMVSYMNGTSGSFISSLICDFLYGVDNTKFTEEGEAHNRLTRCWYNLKINGNKQREFFLINSYPPYEIVMPLHPLNPLVVNTHWFPDFEKLFSIYPKAKPIIITYNVADIPRIKGNFYFKHLAKFGTNHDSIINFPLFIEFKDDYNIVSPKPYYTIAMHDILYNKDKTLNLLSEITNRPITDEIKNIYNEYLKKQEMLVEQKIPWIKKKESFISPQPLQDTDGDILPPVAHKQTFPDTPLYLVSYTRGTSGAFISSLICDFLYGIDKTTFSNSGNAHPRLLRCWKNLKINEVSQKKWIYLHSYPPYEIVMPENPLRPLVINTHHFPNFERLFKIYPKAEPIIITYTANDVPLIHNNILYKTDTPNTSLENNSKMIEVTQEHSENTIIPDFKHYKLPFFEIMNNKNKTLAMLSQITGKPITKEIDNLYNEYLLAQQPIWNKMRKPTA